MSVVERHIETAVPTILDPRVVRGAELLDERMPGWAEHIGLDDLDLGDAERCVLGQIGLCVFDADYCGTVERLFDIPRPFNHTLDEEFAHGFVGEDFDAGDWRTLEQDWRLAILSRRTPA